MIFKYYNFLIESANTGIQEHFLIGSSISLIIYIIISVIIVLRVQDKNDKILTIFFTTLGSFVLSLAWPLVLYIFLGGIVLPLAIIGGTIVGLCTLINYLNNKKKNFYNGNNRSNKGLYC